MNSILSVSQLNRYISFKFKDDIMLRGRLIKGEISNFTCHTKSGHCYFTLKDSESSIKAVMFKSFAVNIKFDIKNGMSVIVLANVQVYERDGQYQLYVTDIQPSGLGALYLQVEQLKQKLSSEGLFDEDKKLPLPRFPRKIGIITAESGAALQDMLNIISRRYPIADILIFPVYVQGEYAADSIADAVISAQSTDCDVLIVGRGGGSYEDLMPFNSEKVARALHDSDIPVISAVGHETDITLSDFAADLRAPTPSAAAELCVPDMTSITDLLNKYRQMLYNSVWDIIYTKIDRLGLLEKRLETLSYSGRIINAQMRSDLDFGRLCTAYKTYLAALEQKLRLYEEKLETLNPEMILKRGFSIVYLEEMLVKSYAQLSEGQKIKIKFGEGEITATVNSVIKE